MGKANLNPAENQPVAEPMTRERFDRKWGDVKRDKLTLEKEREFVEDVFQLYEHIGFAERFNSPYDQPNEHNGMKFKVIRRATEFNNETGEGEVDLESMPVWVVRFENGDEACCYPEEICKAEKSVLLVENAEQMMRDMLSKESMGDRVYEFAQKLFHSYINVIEAGHRIVDDEGEFCGDSDDCHDGVAWYDDIQEEFFQAVYDRIKDFLENGE